MRPRGRRVPDGHDDAAALAFGALQNGHGCNKWAKAPFASRRFQLDENCSTVHPASVAGAGEVLPRLIGVSMKLLLIQGANMEYLGPPPT